MRIPFTSKQFGQLTAGAWLLLTTLLMLPVFFFWSAPDMWASGAFYTSGAGFALRDNKLLTLIHEICQHGTRAVIVFFLYATVYFALFRKKTFGLDARAAIFMIAVLLVGPGLVTNTLFKDFWGRARPYQIQEFGGNAHYTPPLVMADQCDHNCSFFSGDGALGFSLHMVFYIVPLGWRRRTFWAGWLGGGLLFGSTRIMTGSHFLSDVMFAGTFMLLVAALVHILFYGWNSTKDCWRSILCKEISDD